MLRPGVTQEYGWAKETKENIIDASLADGEDHSWELQSIFPSSKVNCSKNTKVSKQVVKKALLKSKVTKSSTSGKAPYHLIHTGPTVDRYADQPLPGGDYHPHAGRRNVSPRMERNRGGVTST
ncbi:hypothetical protein B296_00034625, partial [Ensete ventricosum]